MTDPVSDIDAAGWLNGVRRVISPNCDARPAGAPAHLAVIHARIDDIEYARLSEEGGSMTVEEAIILALEKIHR